MAAPPPLPLVVPVAMAPVEDPVEASLVVDFPVEADFLLPLTGPVEILPVPSTSTSVSFPTSLGSRALLLAAVEQVQ